MKEKGQALIILVVTGAVAITVLTAAIIASVSTVKNSFRGQISREILYATEGGLEWGLTKVMRDDTSCSGQETMTIGQSSVIITFTSLPSGCEILSTGSQGSLQKKVQAQGAYDSNRVFVVTNWAEIP